MARPTNAAKEKKFLKAIAIGNSIPDSALLAGYNVTYIYDKLKKDVDFAERTAAARAGLKNEIINNITNQAKLDPTLGLKVMAKLDRDQWGDTKVIEHTASSGFEDMMRIMSERAETLLIDDDNDE